MSGVGAMTLAEITAEVRKVNIEKGWRPTNGGIYEGQTWGDYVALLHSEVGEALEAYRDHRLADATRPVCGKSAHTGLLCPEHGPDKPQGVGSEFADILIRLIDMVDVWDLDLRFLECAVGDMPDFEDFEYRNRESFGDWMAWLHWRIAEMDAQDEARNYNAWTVLRALVTTARHFGIDLETEYRRKIAYNATRPYQHGGRTLAGDKETKDA